MTVITFNPDGHTYHDERGARWPSVTEILGGVGLIDFAGVNYSVLERGRDRGSKVHEMLWYFDEDDLDQSSIDPSLEPYLVAYKTFLRDSGFIIDKIEHQVHHETYKFAGTLDRTGSMDGRSVLFDIKTGQVDKWAALQTAAYAECLPDTPERYALQLMADENYRLHKHSDHRDRGVFLAAVTLYNWKGK